MSLVDFLFFQLCSFLAWCVLPFILISTAIGEEFNDLEQQWISVQEQKKTLQKIEKTKLRTQ